MAKDDIFWARLALYVKNYTVCVHTTDKVLLFISEMEATETIGKNAIMNKS